RHARQLLLALQGSRGADSELSRSLARPALRGARVSAPKRRRRQGGVATDISPGVERADAHDAANARRARGARFRAPRQPRREDSVRPAHVTTDPGTPLPADVVAAIQQGDKIDAIKRLRAVRGLDLKEAKDIVDAYVRRDPLLARKYQNQAANARPLLWLLIA